MAFFQDPPALDNQYAADRVLSSYIARTFAGDARAAVDRELGEMGALSGGELYQLQLADRLNEPRLIQWDAWGRRTDTIEVTPLWQRAARIAAERGLVATGYEKKHGALSRVLQFALVYLFDPSSDTYTCPLAMTDGAARTLLEHDAAALVERAVTRLTSRDRDAMWTSGQWMTERTGGSDVGLSETIAKRVDGELHGQPAYRLYGTKWFTSAITSDMALTLARPEGEAPGGRGLTLFYLETRDAEGRPNGLSIDRLKDKLGTRKLPTAELSLDGALAAPVTALGNGVRNIVPMLNVTRTWNAVCSVAAMRRGVALASDYARRRVQFGAPLSDKALHVDTLAGVQAELEGAFMLAFRVAELLGRIECGEASEDEERLLRLLTPVAKLTTGKQAVAATSEVLECFGGAGYVEDTGLPRLLRDAQVFPIWEGTTNVLSLDLLRGAGRELDLSPIARELDRLASACEGAVLVEVFGKARAAFDAADHWLQQTAPRDQLDLEAGARRFALTIGRSLELALLTHHASWCQRVQGDARSTHAAVQLAANGVDMLRPALARTDARAMLFGPL